MDEAFERLLRKTEQDAQEARARSAVAHSAGAVLAARAGAPPASSVSPLLRAVGQAVASQQEPVQTQAPHAPPAIGPVRKPVTGPPSGNANLVDASDEFEVYERPMQPGEHPKSRGLRQVRESLATGYPRNTLAGQASPATANPSPANSPTAPAYGAPGSAASPAPPASASAGSAGGNPDSAVPMVYGIPAAPAAMFALPLEETREIRPWVPDPPIEESFDETVRPAPASSAPTVQLTSRPATPQVATAPGSFHVTALPAAPSPSALPTTAAPRPAPPSAARAHFSDAPAAQPAGPEDNPRIAIVQADYNLDITNAMAEWARQHAEKLGATVVQHLHVPGAYDAPLAAKILGRRSDVDAIVVIGCVLQGETGHDLVITQACADQLSRLSCELEKPIGFGVVGPRITRAQAEARVAMGRHAVESVVLQWRMLRTLAT